MTTPPANRGDGTEPVSLDKSGQPEPSQEFDPYRFGQPDYPIAAEYAPPGYTGPILAPQPAPYQPPTGYGPPTGYPPPSYPNFPAVPPPPAHYSQYPQPRTGHGKAIAAMALGVASIVLCWTSFFDLIPIVLAVVFGVLALNEANRRPSKEGRGLAIGGLVCALIGAILATVLTVVIIGKYGDCIGKDFGSSAYTQCINEHS